MNFQTNASVVPFAVHSRERRSQPAGWNKQSGEPDCESCNPEVEFQSSGRHPNTGSKPIKRSHEIGKSNQPKCPDETGSGPQKFSSLFEDMESKCETHPAFPIQDACNAFEDTDGGEVPLSMAAREHSQSNVFEALIQYPISPVNVGDSENWRSNSHLDEPEIGISENDFARSRLESRPAVQAGNSRLQMKSQLHATDNANTEPFLLNGLVIPFDRVAITIAGGKNPSTSVFADPSVLETGDAVPSAPIHDLVTTDAEIAHVSTNMEEPDNMRQLQPIMRLSAASHTAEKPKLKSLGHGQGEAVIEFSTQSKSQSEVIRRESNISALSQIDHLVSLDIPSMKSPAQQIAENIKQSTTAFGLTTPELTEPGGPAKILHVKLQPEGLGDVQLAFTFRGGKVHIRLSSEKGSTSDILQSDSTNLISEIRQAVPSFEMVEISFSILTTVESDGKQDNSQASGDMHKFHNGGTSKDNPSESSPRQQSPPPSSNSKTLEAHHDGIAKPGPHSVRHNANDAIYL